MSKPAETLNHQNDLFFARLSQQLNPRHPLLLLSSKINWTDLERDLNLTFSSDKAGQPPKPVRLIVGLLMLQHMEGLSDEQAVEKWVENPYWQAFCGFDFLQWKLPIDASSLVRWRGRLDEKGMEIILSHTLKTAVTMGAAQPKDFEKVIADTTVMEANIAHPTDAQLLNKARKKLVDIAKKEGLTLRQTYTHVGKKLTRKIAGYAHAKQFKRLSKGVKKLKTYLGRVIRDIERKMEPHQAIVFKALLDISKKLLAQEKKSKNKVYSLHEPHISCISKGKARTPYEFGSKVSLVISHKQGFVLSSQGLANNPYDGHTLAEALAKGAKTSGVSIKQAFVDRGYKGHGVEESEVYISGQRRGMTWSLKRALKRRSAVEPHIGHMKSEGKLRRNFLRGLRGIKLNAVLCGIGHNLRLLLNYIKSLFVLFLRVLFRKISQFLKNLAPWMIFRSETYSPRGNMLTA